MHIEDDKIRKFHRGELNAEEIMNVLEHTDTCSFCADKLMSAEEEEQIEAPAYLKDNLMERIKMPDIKIKEQIKITSKKTELFFYSLKTTAAVVMALLLLASVSHINAAGILDYNRNVAPSASVGTQLFDKSNEAANLINDFSNRIINGGSTR
ncbi:anti-sigma factor [Konateibacter massiliensis]|uniref:hypothetical protein n=1 Tax=Konateibacter massiliensis TaxID=2002841 RepID=UPI000C15D978|nr:hypothetical protein [Konateibacter massiliensis]